MLLKTAIRNPGLYTQI